MIKSANRNAVIAMVGGQPTAQPEQTLAASDAIDIVGRKEFDLEMKEVAEGREWSLVGGISSKNR